MKRDILILILLRSWTRGCCQGLKSVSVVMHVVSC